MPSRHQPPTAISTPKPKFSIAQLSDMHLTGKIGVDVSYQRFLTILELAMADAPDLLLLTGDLVNDGNTDGYDWLFHKLSSTGVPFICLAGNHDVTHDIGIHLPHDARIHIALSADNRLAHQHRLSISLAMSQWQLLCLDSSVPGAEFGRLSADSLAWLDDTLAHHQLPTIIALHHHPMAVGAAWIDKLMLRDAEQFNAIIGAHPHVQAVLCGHVHQAHTLSIRASANLYTCPATARQFAPFIDEFSIDHIPAGYRVIQIDNHNRLASYIKRSEN